ncbi:MAG: sugar ABC transporter substrate-binding protein [Sphaerochaetaceae bacterium]|nr:sugar ABC transporter substrate-binding protein [Sphaerochaetaceae bacterium]
MNNRILKNVLIVCLLVLILVPAQLLAEGQKESQSEKDQLTFMMISRDITDPFHALIAEGAQKACDEIGAKFILKDSNNDLTTQLNLIDTAITMKVDGVAINSVDSKGVIPGVMALNNAGIPDVGFDIVPEGGELVGAIGVDNYKVARDGAVILGQLLEEKYNNNIPEDGVILNIQGAIAILIAQQRSDGFTDYISEKYPNLTIASAPGNFNPTDANRVTSDLLTRYGDRVIGISLCTGCMADGVDAAFESSGYSLKDVIFVDNGAFPVDLDLIKQGKLDSNVIIPCSAQGDLSVKLLYWSATGQTDKLPKPGQILNEEGAVWGPAEVVAGDAGPIVQLNCSMLCPQDVDVDDMSLFGNEYQEWQAQQNKK